MSRKHGEVNFYLTQFLSGHCCFGRYLHRFRHAEFPLRPTCPDNDETPEHMVSVCPWFMEVRSEMFAGGIENLGPDNTVGEGRWPATGVALILPRRRQSYVENDCVLSVLTSGC